MRAADFLVEDEERSDIDSNIVTTLSLIQNKVKDGHLKPEIPTQLLVRLIRNTGLASFSVDDLKDANSSIPAMKNIIKQIRDDVTTFVSDDSSTVTNTQDYQKSVDNPEQTVSNMAKAAMKRRQK